MAVVMFRISPIRISGPVTPSSGGGGGGGRVGEWSEGEEEEGGGEREGVGV